MAYHFYPKLNLSLLSVCMLAVLISLGFWQLRRADQKRIILQRYQYNRSQPTMQLANLSAKQDYEFRKVQLQGYFDENHSQLLDNQIYQQQVGYFVLTPFKNEATKQWILVNRGWIPQGKNRQQLPTINKPIPGAQTIAGQLKRPMHLLVLKADQWNTQYPQLIQNIDLSKLAQNIQQPFYNYILLLSPKNPNGFIRPWTTPVPRVSVARHIAYAIQWFLMATIVCILYFVASIRKEV